MINYIDTHSHLHDKAFDEDREKIIIEMEKMGVITITVGTDYEESKKAVALAQNSSAVFASVGMHPVDNRNEEFVKERYLDLAKDIRVVAIGECGLDYFRLEEDKKAGFFIQDEDEKERQKKIFAAQVELAVEVDKPLMLHGRPSKGSMDAYDDMLEIIRQAKHVHGDKVRGNFHFFVGNTHIAERILNLHFTMSFSGVITFAKEYEEVVRFVPLDMMHAETDSPYVSPATYRGKRNQPLYVSEVIAKIAEIKVKEVIEVKKQLLQNSFRVFGLTDR